MTPFYQASCRSLAYQFTIYAPLMCHPFSILGEKCIFSLVLGQNFSFQEAKFQNFRSQDPSFFKKKENLLPRPFFWKPVWHIPTKKGECPPWVPMINNLGGFSSKLMINHIKFCVHFSKNFSELFEFDCALNSI